MNAEFLCDETFEGYPGVLHGGVISMILDGAMGNCIFARGQTAVTVEMITKFRHPIVTCRRATIKAVILKDTHPLYLLEAKIIQDGKIKATAKGKFYNQPDLINILKELK
ncbi:MAG: PaaI family thioesterase [Phycisphaerae bacterium]|nr:PaaI family thioesterase [Phycisphaerae bacterium]